MLRRVGCLVAVNVLVAVVLGAQSPPQSAPPPSPASSRPNVAERPWTTKAGSPYDRAQAVAAERLRPATPSIDFPVVDAPPGELPGQPETTAPGAAPGTVARTSAAGRPWSNDPNSPYARAHTVAAQGLTPDALQAPAPAPYPYAAGYPVGLRYPYGERYPYLQRYSRPVLVPFRRAPAARRWRGGVIYPALPFPPIRGW